MLIRKIRGAAVALITALSFTPSPAPAAVILQIDISNPNAVLFTATEAYSSLDSDNSEVYEGVTLLGFFSSQPGQMILNFESGSTLKPFSSDSYGSVEPRSITNSDTTLDLAITGNAHSTQYFFTDSPPFTGSATVGMFYWKDSLTVGTTGKVVIGDYFYTSVYGLKEIGDYEVIPEPTTTAFSVLALGLLAVGMYRQRSANTLRV